MCGLCDLSGMAKFLALALAEGGMVTVPQAALQTQEAACVCGGEESHPAGIADSYRLVLRKAMVGDGWLLSTRPTVLMAILG